METANEPGPWNKYPKPKALLYQPGECCCEGGIFLTDSLHAHIEVTLNGKRFVKHASVSGSSGPQALERVVMLDALLVRVHELLCDIQWAVERGAVQRPMEPHPNWFPTPGC